MLNQSPIKKIASIKLTINRARPLSAYEQAKAQQLVAHTVADSKLPQPQARWLGQQLWQRMRQNRFSLSQIQQWLQYQRDKISHQLTHLRSRPLVWRQGGLALALAIGLTVGNLSQPLLVLAQEPVGDEFLVNTTTTNTQVPSSVAVAEDGDFVITWTSKEQDGSGNGIYAQRYKADGTPQGNEFQVNTTTTNDQYRPSIGLAEDGDFVITWMSEDQDGDQGGVYAQRYNADGTPQGSEFKVNSTVSNNQGDPSVGVAEENSFVIAWVSKDQDGDGIYAQRYDTDGIPQGSEFRVNTTTTSDQNRPSIGVAEDGDFVIAWMSSGQDGSGEGIYAQRYDADGTPQDAEFLVNTTSIGDQRQPSVGVADDGDFIITWQSSAQDGDGLGIYAQRYDEDGTSQGSEFQVNTTTTNNQRAPSIDVAEDGDFIITWMSFGQDGDKDGIYARRYQADGTPQSGEFRVNTTTVNSQRFPSVGVDDNGDFFVITWSSEDQDGSEYGIYAQRYGSPTSKGEKIYLPVVLK